jgi:hypothetical protein
MRSRARAGRESCESQGSEHECDDVPYRHHNATLADACAFRTACSRPPQPVGARPARRTIR